MIQNGVVAVVIGQSGVVTNVYTPLHAAHMPTFLYGIPDKTVLSDTTSTFAFGNPFAVLADMPIAVAKANKIKKVAAAVIDVPAATSFWESEGPAQFKKAGIGLDVVRIPVGAADVTPQMQRIVSSGAGLVHTIGANTTCIAVLNGLHAVGYTGKVTTLTELRRRLDPQGGPGLRPEGRQRVGDGADRRPPPTPASRSTRRRSPRR